MPELYTDSNLSFTDSNHNIKVYADVDAGVIVFEGNRISINPKATGSIEALEMTTDASIRPRIRVRYKKDTNYAGRRMILRGRWAHQFFKEDGTRVSTASTKAAVVSEIVAYLTNEFEKTVASQLANSTLVTYQQYASADYAEGNSDGTALKPWPTVQQAVNAASDGDKIFLKGVFNVTTPVTLPSTKSLYFFGGEAAAIQYASYAATNGACIAQLSSGITKAYEFDHLAFKNTGTADAISINSASKVVIRDCEFSACGWNGTRLSTTAAQTGTWGAGGTLGHDSTQADLQSFYASANASDSGAIHVCHTAVVDITDCVVSGCNRGIMVEDCGENGAGVIARNRSYNNLGIGIYLKSSSGGASPADGDGCENFTVYNNVAKANADCGVVVEGGKNNIVSLNRIEQNWAAGVLLQSCSDTRARDMDLDGNNRADYTGIGTAASAKGSIQISGGGIRTDATYLCEVLDTTVQNTSSVGSSTTKNGLFIASDLPAPVGSSPTGRARIAIDDCSFVAQDYGIVCEDDADHLRLSISDCRYTETATANVHIPNGSYTQVPYSNIQVDATALDFSADATGSLIYVKEASKVIATYGINELSAQAFGTYVRIVVKDSQQIQWDSLPVSGLSIGGTSVNAVLNQAVVQLNGLFANSTGFASGGDPVTAFALSGDNLTITLQGGTSYTADVTTLGVDTNNFVASGALSGTNLVLTMSDSSTVTIDATNMINASQLPALTNNWYIAYGADAGTQMTSAGIINSVKDKQPFYNGSALAKGEEFVWTHNDSGNYAVGVWSGAESYTDESLVLGTSNWSTMWRFVRSSGKFEGSSSMGVDLTTRYATGYSVTTGSTVLALAYETDNYLSLYDVTGNGRTLIAKSNTALVGDTKTIFFGGENQPNAVFPVAAKRYSFWSVVHDLDSSETSIYDGAEQETVLKSALGISPGQKLMVNFNYFGRAEYVGLNYAGAASGNNGALGAMENTFRYSTGESFVSFDGWTLNTSASGYDSGTTSWGRGSGTDAGMVSLVYNNDNSLEWYSEDLGEVIATKTTAPDGSEIFFHVGFNEAHPYTRIPAISRQAISGGSQPTTNHAPDISNQSFNITEGQSFNAQVALDANSDIVNQYVEEDAPSWAVMNQATGVLNGTAPAHNGSSDSYVINCKAANAIGGVVNFTVTLNVQELTYANTKSLEFDAGVNSYLGGNAALVTALERASNGAGSGDAWTIAFWWKPAADANGQTLFYFGGSDTANTGHIEIRQVTTTKVRVRYGSTNNYLQIQTLSGAIPSGAWAHICLTYDGGTTGAESTQMSTYFSRFKLFINGSEITNANTSNSNYGFTDGITGQNFRFGRFASGNYPRGGRLNQLAIWDTDESGSISTLYNGGSTFNLGTLTGSLIPSHYYEIETSTTLVSDTTGSAHLVGYNFDSTDLVTDAP